MTDPLNKIKFIDQDGSEEVIPMTARTHRPDTPHNGVEALEEISEAIEQVEEDITERVEEDVKKVEEDVKKVEEAITERVEEDVVEQVESVENAIEQHVKELEKMDNVLEDIKNEEFKKQEEALSLVVNAVEDLRSSVEVKDSSVKVKPPKGCCVIQ